MLQSTIRNVSLGNVDLRVKAGFNDVIDSILTGNIMMIFLWTATTIVQLVSMLGVITNAINVICFVKQGFKDPVNISLLALAISDLGSLLPLLWVNICYSPAVFRADLPFDSLEFQYLTGSIPHTTFTRITAWITALITLERCICITAPLKVNRIVTTKRVTVLLICVFVILLSSVAPLYVVNRIGSKIFPETNTSKIGLLHTESREVVEQISFVINNTIMNFSAFVVITVCTIVLVVQLRQKTKWRAMSTSSTQADTVSDRNQKVAKMVVMISLLFIVCFTPVTALFMAMSMVAELSVTGKYRNIQTVIGAFGFLLESINSSVNIFIYYNMSSKYKAAFNMVFSKSLTITKN